MLVPRSCQLNILQRQDLIDYVSSRFGVSCSPVSLGRCGTSGGTSAEEFVTQTSGNKKSNGATFALPFILSSSQRKEQHKYQQQQQQKNTTRSKWRVRAGVIHAAAPASCAAAQVPYGVTYDTFRTYNSRESTWGLLAYTVCLLQSLRIGRVMKEKRTPVHQVTIRLFLLFLLSL